MPRAITKCPQCGQPVSPFAAGCAVCGTDLEAARARLAARRRPSLPGLPRLSTGLDWVQIVVGLVLALSIPPLGFVLSLYWASQHNRAAEPVMVAAMLATAALAVAAFVAPVWFWSHIL